MAETTTKEPSSTPEKKQEARETQLNASLSEDPRFRFGPAPIQTWEDAVQAYLRQEINEEELRAAQGKFGLSSDHVYVVSGIERPDKAFEVTLPEDLLDRPKVDVLKVDQRLEEAERKAEEREKATEAADRVAQDAKPETDLATLQNRQSAKAVEDFQRDNPPKGPEDVSNEVQNKSILRQK